MAAGREPPFEILEHTADVGVVARGRSLAEAFANAAAGMFSIMTDLDRVQEHDGTDVSVRGRDVEHLLVRWLSELLYHFETDRMLYRRFTIQRITATELEASALGERYAPERHEIRTPIKAVTYHQLEVKREDGGARVRVIFDI
ncbi:MAG TPA: archease [Dehalococcoidia bacterium]